MNCQLLLVVVSSRTIVLTDRIFFNTVIILERFKRSTEYTIYTESNEPKLTDYITQLSIRTPMQITKTIASFKSGMFLHSAV